GGWLTEPVSGSASRSPPLERALTPEAPAAGSASRECVAAAHHAREKDVVGNGLRGAPGARSRARSPGEAPAGADCQKTCPVHKERECRLSKLVQCNFPASGADCQIVFL